MRVPLTEYLQETLNPGRGPSTILHRSAPLLQSTLVKETHPYNNCTHFIKGIAKAPA